MIGNDIIDLERAKIESDWRRKGYLNKLFTSFEQELINSTTDLDIMVWSLWSMKEAVYKAEYRSSLKFEYAPLNAYCIDLKRTIKGFESQFVYNEKKYFTITEVIPNFIHTIAFKSKADYKNIKSIVRKYYPKKYESYLKTVNFLSHQEKIFKNEYGVPSVLNIDTGYINPLSISHHGDYLGVIRIPVLIN